MRKLFHSLSLLSVISFCAAVGPAQAQNRDNTFGGAIAPSPNSINKQKEPEGYRGVIPGHVAPLAQPQQETQNPDAEAQDETQNKKPAAHTRRHAMSVPDPGMSLRPGFRPHRTLTAEDLKQIAAMTGVEVRLDKIPPNMADAMHMPAHLYPIVSLPQPRRDGMLPPEFNAKQAIDRFNQQINEAAQVSPEAKKKAVDDAVTALSNLARFMRMQRDVPQEIYETMGVPATYVKESREGSGKAATRLEDELKTLQSMQ